MNLSAAYVYPGSREQEYLWFEQENDLRRLYDLPIPLSPSLCEEMVGCCLCSQLYLPDRLVFKCSHGLSEAISFPESPFGVQSLYIITQKSGKDGELGGLARKEIT